MAVRADLNDQDWAVPQGLIGKEECNGIAALYDSEDGFRSRVIMARRGFGRGDYRYFSYPLPPIIQDLRTDLYPHVAVIANRWYERLAIDTWIPAAHREFLETCHAAGQTRPTLLLLRYGPEDYNCLAQDLYGEHVFPLQVATLLSERGRDFTGGEFVLTELRPRMQTRCVVVPLAKGDAVVFAVNSRPVRSTRGDYRVALRHGVRRIHEGCRHTLGVIFHDAA